MILSFPDYTKFNGYPLFETNDEKTWMNTVKKETRAIIISVNDGKPFATRSDEEYYYINNSERPTFSVYGVIGQSHSMFKLFHDKWCVYRITNCSSGKVYHGESKNLLRRIYEHCENSYDAKTDNEMCTEFMEGGGCCFEVLFVCDTYEEAREIEKAYNNELISAGKKYTYNKNR